VRQIAELQLKSAVKRLESNGINMSYTSQVLNFVAEKGYQPEYGGRPVKRVINTYIIDAISSAILNGNILRNQLVECDIQNETVVFHNICQ
jgi:ATP-dependent Clp protease ATP-binding subunit ClpB